MTRNSNKAGGLRKPAGKRVKTLQVLNPALFCTTSEFILGCRYVVELLTEAVTFIEKLENHLQTVKTIPQVPTFMKNLVSGKKIIIIEPFISSSIKNSVLFCCLASFCFLLD